MSPRDESVEDRLTAVEECMAEMGVAIYGSERLNALGLMKRVSSIEDAIRRWQNMETMMRGALVIMALTSGVNIFALIKSFLP